MINLKKDDKIICITNYSVLEEGITYEYKQGDVWVILSASILKDIDDRYPIKAISESGVINNFKASEMKNFITISEWRDKRIDQILEDD
jgi:uncharacterized membrane protein